MSGWNGTASLLAACIELFFIINLLLFAEKNNLNKIAVIITYLLFGYQLLEYLMCGLGLINPLIPFLAFAVISFLPPFNLLFALILSGRKKKWHSIIFLPAVLFVLFYAFNVESFEVVSCAVFYAVYNYPLGDLYGFFYYLPLIFSMIILIKELKKDGSNKHLLKILLAAHIIISLPVIIAFSLKAFGMLMLLSAIESIMCKFALIYAAALFYFGLSYKEENK